MAKKEASEFQCKKCKQEFENARRLGYHMYASHGIRGKSKSSQRTWQLRDEGKLPLPKRGRPKILVDGLIPDKVSTYTKKKHQPQLDEMILAVNIRRDAINDAYADVARLLQGLKGGGK